VRSKFHSAQHNTTRFVISCRVDSVKLHLRDERTDGRTKRNTSFLSAVSVGGVHPMGGTKFKGGGGSGINLHEICPVDYQENNYIINTRCHILKLKCTKFYSRRLPVRSSVRLCLRWNLTQTRREERKRNVTGRFCSNMADEEAMVTDRFVY